MLKIKTESSQTKTEKTNMKLAAPKKKIKVSLEQMDKMKASELLASRVTCQRRS